MLQPCRLKEIACLPFSVFLMNLRSFSNCKSLWLMTLFYHTHQFTSVLRQPSLSLSLKLMIHYQQESIASQAMERLLVKDQNAKVVFSTGRLGQLITHVKT